MTTSLTGPTPSLEENWAISWGHFKPWSEVLSILRKLVGLQNWIWAEKKKAAKSNPYFVSYYCCPYPEFGEKKKRGNKGRRRKGRNREKFWINGQQAENLSEGSHWTLPEKLQKLKERIQYMNKNNHNKNCKKTWMRLQIVLNWTLWSGKYLYFAFSFLLWWFGKIITCHLATEAIW